MVLFNLKNKDVRTLGLIYKIGQICGIVPFYNFDLFSIPRQKLKNVQALSYIAVGCFGTAQAFYYRSNYILQKYSFLYLIVNYIKEVVLVMTFFSAVMSSSFKNQQNWLRLNNRLQYVDKIFKNRENPTKKDNIYYFMIFYFLFYSIYFVNIIYRWFGTQSFKFKMNWFNEIAFVMSTVLQFLMFSLAIVLLCRYNYLNCLFKGRILTLESMHKIEHISKNLSNVTELYNKVFGWPLLFISAKCTAQLLQTFTQLFYISVDSDLLSFIFLTSSTLYSLVPV